MTESRSSMTPATLVARLKTSAAPVVLDVRSRWEFRRGHVPGARHLPFWRITTTTAIDARREDEVVVYCGHGPRAEWAAAALRRRGFQRVVLLEGHWAAWTREAHPQERGD